jgi:hypothetical protein
MRSFHLPVRFGLICIPFRSFQHLLAAEEQRGTLRRCVAHLLPGGTLALHLANPQLHLLGAQDPGPYRISRLHPGRPLRLTTPDEMRMLLQEAGLRVEAVYGGFAGEPLTAAATEQLWLARRPL